jgi:type I restriction enzyme S subunit
MSGRKQSPAEWKTVQLGEVAEFKNGLNYDVVPGAYPVKVVGVGDFGNNFEPDVSALRTVSLSAPLRDDEYLSPDDLLFVRSNGNKRLIGRCMIIRSTPERLSYSGFTIRARIVADELLPEFVALYMQTDTARDRIFRHGTGTNISNLNQTILGRTAIPLPSLREQRRVIDLFACLRKRVSLLDTLTISKRMFRNGLADRLFGGTLRKPGYEGSEWKGVTLGDLFQERVETQRPDLNLLSITADRGVVPRSEIDRKDSSNHDKRSYKRIAPGDIGYNTMRMWQGVSALSPLEGIVSPAYTVCVPGGAISGSFASHWFKQPDMVNKFHNYSQGLVADTLNLKFPLFAKIPVTLPTLAEQKWIASILTSLDNETSLLSSYRKKLEQQLADLREQILTRALHFAEKHHG